MDWFQVFVLSLVQGLTEFLPISSSGHLVILQKFFGLSSPPILFDILVHVGTLGAVLFYFWRELIQILLGLFKQKKEALSTVWLVFVGTIPAGLVGFLFSRQIELAFNSLTAVGLGFLLTGWLLFSTKWIKETNRQFNQLNWQDALVVGIFQALAILPGISRSGSTIISGLWRGANRQTAFRFSFYLAIPAILGALTLKGNELLISPTNNLIQGLVGMAVAGVVGYFTLRLVENLLQSAKFWFLGIYCLILGVIVLSL